MSFALNPNGLSPEEIKAIYETFSKHTATQQASFLGYQVNQALSHKDLGWLLNVHLNNVGDPFVESNLTTNSKPMEQAVLDYYATLWGAKVPHNPLDRESYWGYVLTMGSTEGNMYGLWQARDYLQGKALYFKDETTLQAIVKASSPSHPIIFPNLYKNVQGHFKGAKAENPNARTPIAFFSEDTHYSIIKICRVLGVQTFSEVGELHYPGQNPITGSNGDWKANQTVPSHEDGHVNEDELLKVVEFFAAHGYPPMIIANFGSTFKGAYDNVESIGAKLEPVLKAHGLWTRTLVVDGKEEVRDGFWLHVDGALGAAYVPFMHMAKKEGLYNGWVPSKFDFSLPFVHSLNTSGHKWPGSPTPTGIFMTKVKYQIQPPSNPEYIGAPDTTFAGSRTGISAVIIWDHLAHHSYKHFKEEIVRNLKVANYAFTSLLALSHKLGEQHPGDDKNWLWVAKTEGALTVRFRRPAEKYVHQYSLSGESLYVGNVARDYSHIYIMEHVNEEKIDQLVAALSSPDAYPASNKALTPIDVHSTVPVPGHPVLFNMLYHAYLQNHW